MDLVLCHTTADFDTLGAAVGAALLRPGSRIVLAGDAHPAVQDFLALWRDKYPLIERRSVVFEQVRSLTLVDASRRDRFSPVQDWIQQAEQTNLPIIVYDHHVSADESDQSQTDRGFSPDFPTAEVHIEAVGAVTTLIVEALQQQAITLTPFEATVMALGIHSDTGSLTFEQSTPRDAQALTWLMEQGANQQVIANNHSPGLSRALQALLVSALQKIETEQIRGHHLGWVQLETSGFVSGLSGLAERLAAVLGLDTLLLSAQYRARQVPRVVIIGRSRTPYLLTNSAVNLRPIFESLGGGGHAQAASVVLKGQTAGDHFPATFAQMLTAVRSQIPPLVSAIALMSSPVRTILPTTSIDEAQRILLRYGHSGLCVVNQQAELVGIISRRDLDLTLHHGLGHAPVKGFMSQQIKSVAPETPITDIQQLMMTYDIGRLPVLEAGKLVGIVTRSDLLRQLHQTQQACKDRTEAQQQAIAPSLVGTITDQAERQHKDSPISNSPIPNSSIPDASIPNSPIPDSSTSQQPLNRPPTAETLYQQLEARLTEIWPALMLIADVADQKGWALYLVGGAVRDLLLSQLPANQAQFHALTDIDLVVEGAEAGAGVALAQAIQARYPQVSVQVHGQFQTAALIWHHAESSVKSPVPSDDTAHLNLHREPLLIDIATARTEFYPYPAANPEVEASTIRQDLYRRDFTINAMAIKLNHGTQMETRTVPGQLLDYFGGWLDLQHGHVRGLHANSFIEDPTRIFRAVRFAVRLGFSIEPQTEQFIRYAISSGIYAQMQASKHKTPALQTRLKAELKYLLSDDHWEASLALVSRLGALACLHSSLAMTPTLWRQLRRMSRWLNKFNVNYLGNTQPHWLMLLELIIAQLDPPLRDRIAIHLDLGTQSQRRLHNLHLWEDDLIKHLPNAQRPSQIYSLLQKYGSSDLLLMSDRHPHTLGSPIWQYITQIVHHPPLINGNSLKQLGYQPGAQFRDILNTVNSLTLDGELTTAQEAESYVLTHYPLNLDSSRL